MANFNIPQELIDKLATEEVNALLDGLSDDAQRHNPAFLAKVRQFLKDKSPFDGGELKELIINKYYPGNWIPLHRDTHQYRFFVLVPIGTIMKRQSRPLNRKENLNQIA